MEARGSGVVFPYRPQSSGESRSRVESQCRLPGILKTLDPLTRCDSLHRQCLPTILMACLCFVCKAVVHAQPRFDANGHGPLTRLGKSKDVALSPSPPVGTGVRSSSPFLPAGRRLPACVPRRRSTLRGEVRRSGVCSGHRGPVPAAKRHCGLSADSSSPTATRLSAAWASERNWRARRLTVARV